MPPTRPAPASPDPRAVPVPRPNRAIPWLLAAILVTAAAIFVVLLLMYLNRPAGNGDANRPVFAGGGGNATQSPAPKPIDADTPAPSPPPPSNSAPLQPGPAYIAPAGRSPIPAPNEEITTLIAAGKVQDQTRTGGRPPSHLSDATSSRNKPIDAATTETKRPTAANDTGFFSKSNPTPEAPASAIPWNEAGNYVGKQVTVEGKIVDTHNTGKVCFLNFSRDRKSGFYAIIFQDALGAFGEPPEKHFMGKTIRVSGEVSMRDGRPQIQVRRAGQIAIVP